MSADSPWKSLSLAEIASGRITAPPPLFGDLILDNSLVMICAPPFTGKTMLMMDMIICLDTGRPLLGRYAPPESKRVLAFLQDAPTWDYAEQVRKLVRGHNLEPGVSAMLEGRLVINKGVQITAPDFIDQLRAEHHARPFDVLMFDALWRLHNLDVNNESQAGAVLKRLAWARDELGCAVVFTHHERKISAADLQAMNINHRARGSGVLGAGTDANLFLTRDRDVVSIMTGKARGGMEEQIEFGLRDVAHSDGPALRLVHLRTQDTRLAQLLRLLGDGPKTRADLIVALRADGISAVRAARVIDNDLRVLHTSGRIEPAGRHTWQLAERRG